MGRGAWTEQVCVGTVSDNGQLAGDSVFVVQLHHQSIAQVYGKHYLDTTEHTVHALPSSQGMQNTCSVQGNRANLDNHI